MAGVVAAKMKAKAEKAKQEEEDAKVGSQVTQGTSHQKNNTQQIWSIYKHKLKVL